MVSAIIVAAGKGRRMGASGNKVFLEIMGKTIIEHTVSAFAHCDDIDEIIIVTGEEDIQKCKALFSGEKKPLRVIAGGAERQNSVYNGILDAKGDICVIHDGARALITPTLISDVVSDCKKYKAAALGVQAKDTIKLADGNGFIEKTLDRTFTYQIQTPQVFEKELIKEAHQRCAGTLATDDCVLAEAIGVKVKITDGSYENIKLTTPEDILLAESILTKRQG